MFLLLLIAVASCLCNVLTVGTIKLVSCRFLLYSINLCRISSHLFACVTPLFPKYLNGRIWMIKNIIIFISAFDNFIRWGLFAKFATLVNCCLLFSPIGALLLVVEFGLDSGALEGTELLVVVSFSLDIGFSINSWTLDLDLDLDLDGCFGGIICVKNGALDF